MSFLAPALLLLGAAAVVPLLIHLLRRRIGTRVEFPAAMYLARAEQESSRTVRLRNLLLMFLRILVVLLVALAAARPIGRLAGIGHAPLAVAVVLDNSLSSSVIVDGSSLLAQLREAALAAVDAITATDQLWLVTADGGEIHGSPERIREAIGNVGQLDGTGDMALALSRAAALVGSAPAQEKRIAVLTDGQRFEWSSVNGVNPGRAQVELLAPVVQLPRNRSLLSAEARPMRWAPRGELAARISTEDSVSWSASIGSRVLARGTAAPNEEIVVRAAPQERGWVSGRVEIAPDEFRADDERFFSLWIGASPAVAVTSGAGVFAQSAVDALVAAERMARGADVTIGVADEIDALPALILPPPDPVRIGAANRALGRLGVPWRYGTRVDTRADVRVLPGGRWYDEDLTVAVRYVLEPQAGARSDTLATAGGDPWLITGDGYVLLASPLDPLATNLPLRASFVPLVAELVTQWLAGEGGDVLYAFPGASVARPLWADGIMLADSVVTPVPQATFQAPTRVGVYPLLRAGRQAGALIVNAPAGEFELERMTDAELQARLPGDTRVHSEADSWIRAVLATGGRKPLVLPFLVLALITLGLESLLARERRGVVAG